MGSIPFDLESVYCLPVSLVLRKIFCASSQLTELAPSEDKPLYCLQQNTKWCIGFVGNAFLVEAVGSCSPQHGSALTMNCDALHAAWWTLTSCSLNAYSYEIGVRYARDAGQLISFVQMLGVALLTTPQAARELRTHWRQQQRYRLHSPRTWALFMGYFLTFYGTAFLINLSVELGVSIQLVHVSRAGTLVATLILSVIFQRKRYTAVQYICVLLVSAGLVWAALALQATGTLSQSRRDALRASASLWVGIFLLVVNCFLSPVMGILQQLLIAPRPGATGDTLTRSELLCMQHWVAVLLFLIQAQEMEQASLVKNMKLLWRAPVPLSGAGGGTPGELLLMVNTMTQYLCMRSVIQMQVTSRSILYVQLVTALRKLANFLLSAQLFGTKMHGFQWMSLLLVFGGTLGYALSQDDSPDVQRSHKIPRKNLAL